MPERRPARFPPPPVSAVDSPCVRNCCLDERDICLGCFRSLEEIIRWGGADDSERREIRLRADRRKTSANRPKPGDP